MAVAVFKQSDIIGEAIATPKGKGAILTAQFTKLPPGKHGFHIHVAGDLRGEGCAGACAHLHVGPPVAHGDRPGRRATRKATRHSGDLGNIQLRGKKAKYKYYLQDLKPEDLWGRTLIIHADEDDLGLGAHEDSKTTGHSGARIGCAIFGRLAPCAKPAPKTTRKRLKQRGGVSLEVAFNQYLGGNNTNPTKLDAHIMTPEPNIKIHNSTSENYTILMYDPDAVGPAPGSKVNYLHYLVMNGQTCVPYKGPSPPPNTGVHHYTFVLYKQSAPTQCMSLERSPFDLDAFVKENGLEEIQRSVFEVSS
jgi:Cu-Zn family superoxide dismutase